METVYDRLQTILSQDEASLQKSVVSVLSALGVPKIKISEILKNLPELKERAKSLTQEEVDSMIAAPGEEKLRTVMDALEDERG